MTTASGTHDDRDLPFPVRNVPPTATRPESVVRFLVGEMAKLGHVEPQYVEEIVTLVMKREELGATAIGNGIAVPHATSRAVGEFVAIVGRSASAIDWDALDRTPVRLVLLYVAPAGKPETHRKMLAAFAELAKSL